MQSSWTLPGSSSLLGLIITDIHLLSVPHAGLLTRTHNKFYKLSHESSLIWHDTPAAAAAAALLLLLLLGPSTGAPSTGYFIQYWV